VRLTPVIHETQVKNSSNLSADVTSAEFYRSRYFLMLSGTVASLLLLAWGYVVMPREGWAFWLWLLATGVSIAIATYFFQKQLKISKAQLEKTGLALQSPGFRLPFGLVLIAGLGLVANLLVIFANPQPLRFDAWGYSDQGYNIAQQGYKADAIRTPGYPFFVAVVYKLAGGERPLRDPYFGLSDPPNRNLVALWLVQSCLLSLTVLLTYLLTKAVFSASATSPTQAGTKKLYWGNPLALLAAGLVAFCPFLWSYTGTPQTEICAAFWLTLTVYFWFKALRFRTIAIYYLLTGLALAWLLETRPTFVYLPLLALATFAILNKGRWRIFGPLLTLVPLLLMLAPPFAANLREWEEPTPLIAGDLSTYQTNLGIFSVIRGGMPRYQRVLTPAEARATEPDKNRLKDYVPTQQDKDKAKRHRESDYWKKYFADYVSNNPLEFGGTMLKRAWYQWSQHFVFPYYDPAYWDYRLLTDNLNRLYLVFALVGLGIALTRRAYRLASLPLYLSIFYLMGLNLLVQAEFRYTLPAYPLMLIFAACGVSSSKFQVSSPNSQVLSSKFQPQGNPSGRGSSSTHRATLRAEYQVSSFDFKVLAGLVVAFGAVTILSLALPLVPAMTATREKALDAVYASQQQVEGCYFSSARAALDKAIGLEPQEAEVSKWQSQFPKEVAARISTASPRLASDPIKNYDYFRCRGEAYRVQGLAKQARPDFEAYLKYAPPEARERTQVTAWLKELS